MKTLTINRAFLPPDFVVNDWPAADAVFQNLLNQNPVSDSEIRNWMGVFSELQAAIFEDRAHRFIRMTCDTRDKEAAAKFQQFVNEIQPGLTIRTNEIYKKIVSGPVFYWLEKEGHFVFTRGIKAAIELFREENVPIITEIQNTSRRFDEIASELFVEVDGKQLTMAQAAGALETPDPVKRKEIWTKVINKRLSVKEELDELFTKLVGLRHQLALNAGFNSFADYSFAELGRFDYTREDCFRFHDSVEKVVKPAYLKLMELRKQKLGLSVLMPWDLTVDIYSDKPLKPFENSAQLIEAVKKIFSEMHPLMGGMIDALQESGCLDLDSRLGKSPGAYSYALPESGMSFIFMNSAGTQLDLTTMFHECGHSLHAWLSRDLPLVEYKNPPSEVAELASMSMELFCLDYYNRFYQDAGDRSRAVREQIKRTIVLLPWIASIDAFQFWVYDNPVHSAEERANAWANIFKRFHGDAPVFDGYEDALRFFWHKQGHVFDAPFYYIEYGIAQLGAIANWRNYKSDPKSGIENYLNALSLGYSKPIPDIFSASGIRFDFSEDWIRELVGFMMNEMA